MIPALDALAPTPLASGVLAQAVPQPSAAAKPAAVFEPAGWHALADSWQAALALAAGAVLVGLTVWMYRRDSAELRPGYGWMLCGLRVGVLVALAAYLVRYEKRVDRLEEHASRVAVLVDTSLSMARTDAGPTGQPGGTPRIARVAAELTEGPLVEKLRERHHVQILRFDQEPKAELIASLEKQPPQADPKDAAAGAPPRSASSGPDRFLNRQDIEGLAREWGKAVPRELWWSLGVVGAGSLSLAAAWLATAAARGRRLRVADGCWAILGAAAPLTPVVALVALVIQQRDAVDVSLPTDAAATEPDAARRSAAEGNALRTWRDRVKEKLSARGAETRLGQALQQLVQEPSSRPLSAIVVVTDGGQNAGVDPRLVAQEARQAGVALFPIGIGSNQPQVNVRIADLAAPARVFPDDGFDISAYVQATGLAGRTVSVNLYSQLGPPQTKPSDPKPPASPPSASPADAAKGAAPLEKLEGTERVTLPDDGRTAVAKFEIPAGKPGRRTYVVRIDAPPEDTEPKDNDAQAAVDVVERKLRVLLMAGGPSREYQYLRNMLHRDKNTDVDVLLQTARPGPGISQDADAILAEFPRSKAELAAYDAVVALDPDWRALDAEQVNQLEDWVGNQSGGLIVAAGPVYTGLWTGDPKAAERMAKIRALYPVTFPRHGLVLASDVEKFRSTTPWPVELTRAGIEAPFLRLDDSPAVSQRAWTLFPGVFGYYPVAGVKPGATIYARYGTPDAIVDKPIYFAGHFYGAGRVFYLGGGEMWRLRGVDEAYFETLYTRLLRYLSEGRLLRGNKRGMLLVDRRRYVIGDRVEVQAAVSDAQREPLVLPRLAMQVAYPSGQSKTLELTPHPSRKGLFQGELAATEQGTYRLDLEVPGSPYELVSDTLRVLEPDLEGDHSRRDDSLLQSLAEETGGKYYDDIGTIHGAGAGGAARTPLVNEIKDATRLLRLRGTPSPAWDERWAACLVGVMASLMFAEWTLRRLVRLA